MNLKRLAASAAIAGSLAATGLMASGTANASPAIELEVWLCNALDEFPSPATIDRAANLGLQTGGTPAIVRQALSDAMDRCPEYSKVMAAWVESRGA